MDTHVLYTIREMLLDGTKPPSVRLREVIEFIEHETAKANALDQIRAIFNEPAPHGYVFHDDLDRIAAIIGAI